MNDPATKAVNAISELDKMVKELVVQRDMWQQKYQDAILERDAARAERDDHRWRGDHRSLTP